MYQLIRSTRVKAGKNREAVQLAKALADLYDAKFPGHSFQACVETFGAVNGIHWTADFASLTDLESTLDKASADADILALAAKGPECFIENTLHDLLLRTL